MAGADASLFAHKYSNGGRYVVLYLDKLGFLRRFQMDNMHTSIAGTQSTERVSPKMLN